MLSVAEIWIGSRLLWGWSGLLHWHERQRQQVDCLRMGTNEEIDEREINWRFPVRLPDLALAQRPEIYGCVHVIGQTLGMDRFGLSSLPRF
ncbi:hypothetical protein [Leptolyngbya sp. 7M]|uniref:hypothetical protein n=1 Tax=Leptolyngbya sp. 7M TaxID=2812896 RepID=UPI001B8C38FE|nr:hypothetical protein [Leptolyngbya sp. 7M]QYO68934.1 hypothetical protein JVX88_14775 [Leptolyngbya sp. 7M]